VKQISLISFIICLLFSCSETNDILKVECPSGPPTLKPAVCNGTLCQSDTCQTYLGIWKELFLARNQMTQDYFNNHITPCYSHIDKWNDGFSFRITYRIKIDWAEDLSGDQLIIWLAQSTSGLYPSINLPRTTLLTKDQINSALNLMAFSSSLNTISPVNQLKYQSFDDAMSDLIRASGVDNLCTGEIYYDRPHMVVPPSGHPHLRSYGTISDKENKCITSELDLVTGEPNIIINPCIIWFCFTEGTQIMLNNGKSKSIEKIKINDTILSVNIKTMKPEKDIVRKIDVVTHNNIVQISFSDGTLNNNTSDHPYFVNGKGWCSYKPSETLQKYKIETKQLQIGDICFKYLDNKLIQVQVKTIIEKSGETKAYNISRLEKNKNYFANQILVSNEAN
jgi:hypothetical protein